MSRTTLEDRIADYDCSLEDSYQRNLILDLHDALARAIKYEQALREILTHNHRWTMDDYQSDPRDEAYMDDIEAVARAALDKPMEGK